VLADRDFVVTDVKAYLNLDRVNDVDADGGDVDDVWVNDDLQFKITIENVNESEDVEDVEIEGIIESVDDSDDLVEDVSKFTLRDGRKETKELNFKMPSVLEEDDYDMTLRITGLNPNGERFTTTINYTVVVTEPDLVRPETKSTASILQNITLTLEEYTAACEAVIPKMAIIPEVADCKLGLGQSNSERDAALKKVTELQGKADNYDNCQSQLGKSVTEEACAAREAAAKKGGIPAWGWVLVGVGLLFGFNKIKEGQQKPGSPLEEASDMRY